MRTSRFRKMFTALAALTLLTSSAYAGYEFRLPIPGLRASNATSPPGDAISLSLTSGSLPQGLVGAMYEGYDFSKHLTVTGEGTLPPVVWSVLSGLPTGLTLSSHGVLLGTPSTAQETVLAIRATTGVTSAEASYTLSVLNPQISLVAQALPQGTVGEAYSFDFRPLVAVTGDPSYAVDQVRFTGVSLPAGLTLSPAGVLSGIPESKNTDSLFTVEATYRERQAQQQFSLTTLGAVVSFQATSIASAWGATTLINTNSELSDSDRTWTVRPRPTGQQGKSIRIETQPNLEKSGQRYIEVTPGTASAWLLLVGSESGVRHGIALDGPGCTKFSGFIEQCSTWDGSSSWHDARFGVLINYDAASITWYRNGASVLQIQGINTAESYSLQVMDRDVPINTQWRSYKLFPSEASWAFSTSERKPFRR